MDESEEINDENEQDNPNYYLRSKKRRRLLNGKAVASAESVSVFDSTAKRKNPIMFVPTEVIGKIFKFISYNELSSKVRLVNHRFKAVSESLLNHGFKSLEKKIEALIKSTYESLQSTQDDTEIKYICKLLNMLEVIKTQHSFIMSTIWRYVFNKHYRTPSKVCVYAGLIIDVYQKFIWKFTHVPNELYAPSILREYAMPAEVVKIIQMAKSFCVHFDRVIEEPMRNCTVYSGCKVIDILDTSIFAHKTTSSERHSLAVSPERQSTQIFCAKYNYFFENSWFVALPIAQVKEMTDAQKQRMMHMRLRRIALAHTDMFLRHAQYERELMLRLDPITRLRKPGNNVYTGFGDVENMFFYYGVMNEGAYLHKFHLEAADDDEEDEEPLNGPIVDVENNNVNNNRNNAEVNRNAPEEELLYRIAFLGFRLKVKIRCPLPYAPLKYLQNLDRNETDVPCSVPRISNSNSNGSTSRQRPKTITRINMSFECYGAYYPRLPIRYEYEFLGKKSTNIL